VFAAQEDKADLRAVAVGDDDAVAALQQIGNVAHGLDDRSVIDRARFGGSILDERVATDGDDEGFTMALRLGQPDPGAPGRQSLPGPNQ